MADPTNDYTILIVENNQLNLELLLNILNKLDYRLIAARDGHRAIAICEEITPDLILMDVQMPEMDGFETTTRLRKIQKIKYTPVLFTSTFTDSKNILRCFESGGVDYISKPFKDKELLARINTHLSIKQLREQLQTDRDNLTSILQNMLPEGVIRTLQNGHFPKPESTEQAAVIFTDFQNFSILSQKIGSKKSVDHLNLIYYVFDEIIQAYGLERIKTIGDAYFAVGGINTTPDDLYLSPVLAALKMQEFVAYYNSTLDDLQWKLRMGFTIGPVTSGIIGYQKIAYDVWGDTVNLANRLEKESQIGYVAMPLSDYEKVRKYLTSVAPRVVDSTTWGKLEIAQINGFNDSLPAAQKTKFQTLDPAALLDQASSKKSLLNKIIRIAGSTGSRV